MYKPARQRIIARELARAGGDVPRAVDELRRNYETFSTLSATTVRKLLKDEIFPSILLEQQDNLAFANAATELQIEKNRARTVELRNNPVRKRLEAAADDIQELARKEPSVRVYSVLVNCLKALRSMEPNEDDRSWNPGVPTRGDKRR
ncbi:MAG: hypothetical protein ABSE73_29750 [Planctomycetota bacterium]